MGSVFRGWAFIFLLSFSLVCCVDMGTSWRLDSEYSSALTIMASNYKTRTGQDIADTVDVCRIYKVRQKHGDMYSLSELFTKELVFESKDKKFIKRFFSAAQEDIEVGGCLREENQDTLHVIALDNTKMRAGYFLFNTCRKSGHDFGIIMPLQKSGGSSIYCNSPLFSILKDELHLIKR